MAEKKLRESQVDLSRIDSEIDAVNIRIDGLGKVFNYKGRVDTKEQLPSSGNKEGDLYLVGTASSADKSEYFWTGTAWEYLGNTSNQNYATFEAPGIVELATSQEAEGGTDNEKALTPGSIKPVLDKKADLVDGKVPDEQLPYSLNNAVQKTGDTMTGSLTLQGINPSQIIQKSTRIDITSTPALNTYDTYLDKVDKNGKLFGRVFGTKDLNGFAGSGLQAFNSKGQNAEITVKIDENGTAKTIAPTPTHSAKGNEIVTAEWAQKKEQTRITNCLTKIPQDIKLELSNGTLTLKAGSKVYNGDGTIYTNASDISSTPDWGNSSEIVVFPVISETSIIGFDAITQKLVFSGDTAPTFSGNFAYWFDTTIKKVKYTNNAGSSWIENRALPLCLVTTLNNKVTSIDQVFNGFGYIGKTIFVLPGVEGLIPNGRKADGSLNNIKFSVNRLLTRTNTSWNTVYIDNNGIYSSASRKYNEEQNYNYELTGNIISKQISIGRAFSSNDRITSFNPKFVFHAMEYRESIPFNYLGSITVCEGDSAIAGDYTLPQIAQSGADRLCLFCVHLATTQSGGSSMALSSGVVTTPCEIASANNGHGDGAAFFFPVDKTGKITVSFPSTGGGIGNLTSLKLIGYI